MIKLISILLAAAFVAGAAPMAVAGSSAVVFMYHRFDEGDFPSTNTRI